MGDIHGEVFWDTRVEVIGDTRADDLEKTANHSIVNYAPKVITKDHASDNITDKSIPSIPFLKNFMFKNQRSCHQWVNITTIKPVLLINIHKF